MTSLTGKLTSCLELKQAHELCRSPQELTHQRRSPQRLWQTIHWSCSSVVSPLQSQVRIQAIVLDLDSRLSGLWEYLRTVSPNSSKFWEPLHLVLWPFLVSFRWQQFLFFASRLNYVRRLKPSTTCSAVSQDFRMPSLTITQSKLEYRYHCRS